MNKTDIKQFNDGNIKSLSSSLNLLAQEHFSCKVSHYESSFTLPLLKSTNLHILKSRTASKKNLSVDDAVKDTEEEEFAEHPKSTARSTSIPNKIIKKQVEDMQLVKACFCVITSFMKDSKEQLNKGQGTNLFEETIVERTKNFIHKKKWNRSHEEPNGKKKYLSVANRNRPKSAYFTADSGYESDKSNFNKTKLSSHEIDKMSVSDQVQFLITSATNFSFLRDEIYCQILKQINKNPSVRSVALGWILLSLIVVCISPSNSILSFIEEILSEFNSVGSLYCLKRLNTMLEKGERKNSPCSLELQAAKLLQDIRIPVICMDHSVRTVWINSFTTVSEICKKVSSRNRLGDIFGFAIYFSFDNKVVSLGGGDFYIMDAISQAENYASIHDVQSNWRIHFRREFFSPRDAAGIHDNYMKSWLTYSQICGGVRSGEYECSTAQDLALLLAHQYCIRNKNSDQQFIDEDKCQALCDQALPVLTQKEDRKRWLKMVVNTLEALQEKKKNEVSVVDIMEQIIRYASRAFIKNFTKSFFLTSFTIVDEKERIESPKMMKISHQKISIHGSVNGCKEEDEDSINIQLIKVKSIEKVINDEQQFLITLSNGGSCSGRSSQRDEIVYMLQRFINEIKLGLDNESVA